MELNAIVTQLEKVKKDIATAQNEISKAEGKYEVAMQSLQEAGFDSIEKAEAHLEKMRERIQRKQTKFIANVEEFMQTYKEVFNA